MTRKLVIFSIPLSGYGHVNASISICQGLLKKGHRIVFAVERGSKGKLLQYGFEEEVYDEMDTVGDIDFWSDFFNKISVYFRGDYEFRLPVMTESYKNFIEIIKYSDSKIKEIIERVKPDIILQDNYVAYPSIVKSGIPFVPLWSANPLVALDSPNLPAIDSGEPLNDSSNWKSLSEVRKKALEQHWTTFNKWMIDQGAPCLKPSRFQYESKHLNVMMYPKALFEDYKKRVSLSDNWMLLEHPVRTNPVDFQLPESFKAKPGKIVYVSMGSMATADVDLMKRLVAILSKSKHKFIVSMGALHDQYKLAENMYGEPRLPQMEVLAISDLFITHGGNNGFCEGLYFGVPMIVLPLFADQHSNAQRAVEMNLGCNMNPFTVTENELIPKIDEMVNDVELRKRLLVISEQLKSSSSLKDIVDRIEQICKV